MTMRAVVMGGTGLVGSALLRELAADERYRTVESLARRAHAAPEGVATRAVDTHAFTVDAADVAFCALGTTIRKAGSQEAFRAVDHDLVLRFARACLDAGVREFHVVSSLGADPDARGLYLRVKGEMERDVRALGFEGACAYRPSLLDGEREESRPGERAGLVAARLLRPLIPPRYRAIPAAIVARAMARHAATAPRGWHVLESDALWPLAA